MDGGLNIHKLDKIQSKTSNESMNFDSKEDYVGEELKESIFKQQGIFSNQLSSEIIKESPSESREDTVFERMRGGLLNKFDMSQNNQSSLSGEDGSHFFASSKAI